MWTQTCSDLKKQRKKTHRKYCRATRYAHAYNIKFSRIVKRSSSILQKSIHIVLRYVLLSDQENVLHNDLQTENASKHVSDSIFSALLRLNSQVVLFIFLSTFPFYSEILESQAVTTEILLARPPLLWVQVLAEIWLAGVGVFRLTSDGKLSAVQTIRTGGEGEIELRGGNQLLVSHDGSRLFISGTTSGTLVSFVRNPLTGKLTLEQTLSHNEPEMQGLDGANGIAESSDGRFLYVTGEKAGAVSVLKRVASPKENRQE